MYFQGGRCPFTLFIIVSLVLLWTIQIVMNMLVFKQSHLQMVQLFTNSDDTQATPVLDLTRRVCDSQ